MEIHIDKSVYAIDLDKPEYEFHLASRVSQGTPGNYLTGTIRVPPCTSLRLSCVMNDQDKPYPCYLHPILYQEDGKRLRTKSKEDELKELKEKERAAIDAFINEEENKDLGLTLRLENRKVYREDLLIGEERSGSLAFCGKKLSLAIVKPSTKSLAKDEKTKVIEILGEMRIKVSVDGSDLFSAIVKEKIVKNAIVKDEEKEKRKKDEDEERKRRKVSAEREDESGELSFGGHPVTYLGSCVNTLEPVYPATWTRHQKDSLLQSSHYQTPLKLIDQNCLDSVFGGMEEKEEGNSATQTLTLKDLMDIAESDWVMLPRELPVYFLSEIVAEQGIIDFNMEHILHFIRLTATPKEAVYETFGDSWSSGTPVAVPRAPPERLILHKFGGNKLHDAGFQTIKSRRAKGEILKYLPPDMSDEELRRLVSKATLSRTLFYSKEALTCMNYVVIVGKKGPIVWRMR